MLLLALRGLRLLRLLRWLRWLRWYILTSLGLGASILVSTVGGFSGHRVDRLLLYTPASGSGLHFRGLPAMDIRTKMKRR